MVRVVELFAGIGSQHQALKNLEIPHEVVAISEIDQTAIDGYTAIHGTPNNLGDIREIEHLPECDLITYSFPCQDLSDAGNKKGMKEGSDTRSSLLWQVGRLLKDMAERNVLPEVLLMENVNAILNKNNLIWFNKWVVDLNALGYTSSYTVMNAKDYGIPQNRKRCFMVSTLNKGEFVFPDGIPLELRLKDMLEDNVSEEYYLPDEKIAKLEEYRLKRGLPARTNELVYPCDTKKGYMTATDGDGLVLNRPQYAKGTVQSQSAPTLCTQRGSGCGVVMWFNGARKDGLQEAKIGDGLKIYPNPAKYNSGGTVQDGISNTINTYQGGGSGTIGENLRIRYLTPRECLRLMAFKDPEIDRLLDAVSSKSKLYKLAGNSIVVSCLEAIFKGIYIDNTFKKPKPKQISLMEY